MNDDRNFQARRDLLIALLNEGLPLELVAKYLEVHPTTAADYIKRLRSNYGWTKEVISPLKSRPEMLRLYARLSNHEGLSSDLIFIDELRRLLKEYLEVDNIIKSINLTCRWLYSLSRLEFADDVPGAYRALLIDIYEEPKSPDYITEKVWKNYLKDIRSSSRRLPSSTSAIIVDLMAGYTQHIRNEIAPVFTAEVVGLIRKHLLDPLSPYHLAIVLKYYGLDGPKKNLKLIGYELNVSPVTIANHFSEIKKNFIERRHLVSAEKLTWENHIYRLNEAVKKAEDELKLDVAECMETIDLLYNVDKQHTHKHLVEKMDLSVRLMSVLRSMEVVYLEDLERFSETDLLKFRNVGVNTVRELREILSNLNIRLKT